MGHDGSDRHIRADGSRWWKRTSAHTFKRRSRRSQLADAERRWGRAEERAAGAEAELRRLQAALDLLPLGVVVSDEHGTVRFRNRRAGELAEARGADVLVAQAVTELLAEAHHGGPRSRTLDLHGPPARTLVVSAEPISAGEGIRSERSRGRLGTVAISEDITSRRQLEVTRRDLVANVSHELRTPVGALTLLTEALAGETDLGTTRRLAAHIAQETERLGRIIEDLLDLSRLEGEPTRGKSRVRLASVVATAVERVQPVATRRQVALRPADAPPELTVGGDESQLVSAVANLIDNAVKYSEAGSTVELDVGQEDDWVELAVRDHGIGIPTRDLERIFERFYRVDRARSRQTGGTGLGLAIVRHVATNHGGEISVQSTEGEGSTFTLRLPMVRS